MTQRPDGEALARELTLGALSYSDLARRARMVVERLFTRRLPFVHLVVADPDRPDLLQVIPGRDPGMETMEVKNADSLDVEAFAIRLDEPILMGPDVAAECRSRGIVPPRESPQSLLLIPLVRERKKLGALVVGVDLPPGTEITRRWAGLVGATQVISAVLQSCREHERTLADRVDLERIAHAGARLQVLASLPETCALTTRIVVDEFAFDRAILLLPSDDGQRLEGVSSLGHEDICPLLRCPLNAHTDILAQVFHTGMPWMTRDAGEDSKVPVVLRESGALFDAVALPLRVGGQPIGVLWANHDQPKGRISSHRVTLLTLFTAQAAAAISNSRLLRQVETLAEADLWTGDSGRRHLRAVLERELARVRRTGTPLTLLTITPQVHPHTEGHATAFDQDDASLYDAGAVIRRTIRGADFVARVGAGGFVVVMPDTTETQAARARERVEAELAAHLEARAEGAPPLDLSVEIRSADADTVETLLHTADRTFQEAREITLRARLLETLITQPPRGIAEQDPLIANLLKLLHEKEPTFLDHSRRTMHLVLNLGRQAELSEPDCVILALAALLHDVGKISIPSGLLSRPGPLTSEELAAVRMHCVLGEELLRGASALAPVGPILRAHHERFDGRTDGRYGAYPDGLKGDEISLPARILKIADCYDAITSWRCYQPARSPNTAVAILREEKGKSFDPDLVDLFLDYLQPHLAIGARSLPATPAASGNKRKR